MTLFSSRDEAEAHAFIEKHIGEHPFPPVHLIPVDRTTHAPYNMTYQEWSATFDTTWYVVLDGNERAFMELMERDGPHEWMIPTLVDTVGWTEDEWNRETAGRIDEVFDDLSTGR